MSSEIGLKGASGPVGPDGLLEFQAWLVGQSGETAANFSKLDLYSRSVLAGLRRGPDCVHALDVFISVYDWLIAHPNQFSWVEAADPNTPIFTIREFTNLDPGMKDEFIGEFSTEQEAMDYLDYYLIQVYGGIELEDGGERVDADAIPHYMEYDIMPLDADYKRRG